MDLILETADGNCPIEKIAKQLEDCAATLHWTDTARRIIIQVEGDFDDKQAEGFVRYFEHRLMLYLSRSTRDAAPYEDGQSRSFEGKPYTVAFLNEQVSILTSTDADEKKGPEVPAGINLMGESDDVEIGDVKPCMPAGFIQDYLDDRASGLNRLAGVVGQFCIRQGDTFWIKGKAGDWTSTTKGAALSVVKQQRHAELRDLGVRCTPAHLESLFHRCLIPVVTGTLASAVNSDFVEFQSQTYLNRRLAPRLAPTELGGDGRLIRDFILKNTLNDQRPFPEIEAELNDTASKSPTRWALNWFAHLYQRPGVPIPTALWLISVRQGIGKSLSGAIMSKLVGERNASKADQSEMTGDWSDWLVGISLVIADEINVVEKKSFYARLKSWIDSRVVSVRKRGVGQWTIPYIASWMFMTNDLQPIRIDGDDRRMMMIMSTNDLERATAVLATIRPIIDDAKRFCAALAEFGAWLDTIQIDDALLRRAVDTELKSDLIESARDAVESFIVDQIEIGAWKTGGFLTNVELKDRYFAWCDSTQAFAGYRSANHLRNGLVRLRAKNWVKDKATKSARGWVLENPPAQTEPEQSVTSQEVVDFFRGNDVEREGALLRRTRAAQKAQGRVYR